MSQYVLGLSCFYHDSAAVLLCDGQLVAAVQEERFTRRKHDPAFPTESIREVLRQAHITLHEVELIAFYDKPMLKFERLLETWHATVPRSLASFTEAVPVWMREKLFLRGRLKKELAKIGTFRGRLLTPEHHLSHAASAFYPSPFAEAAILTVDGVGEWATTVIGHGQGASIDFLQQMEFPHSLGLLYSAFTLYCGFRVNSGEYKLMGLAPYGRKGSAEVERYRTQIYAEILDLRTDGSFLLNLDYFRFAAELRMCDEKRWEKLFGFPMRRPESALGQEHMDLALAIQEVTEEVILRLARTAQTLTGSRHLVMAGGVALNCVANGKLLDAGIFDSLWIQPAAGDAGGALGAAMAARHIALEQARNPSTPGEDAMAGAFLGPTIDKAEIKGLVARKAAVPRQFPDKEALLSEVARRLEEGRIVGWVQGRMEWGPRSLGGRSILGDARNPDMQKRLNIKTKFREGFRPFAPAVLEERAKEWFDLATTSPYMLLVAPVAKAHRKPLPANFASLEMMERLYIQRSDIPAVTHVDFSARVQTVSAKTNPGFHALLRAFEEKTGCPILVNTSFNVRGEPIVCNAEDAYRCFMRCDMDDLVIEDALFIKEEQPQWTETKEWKNEYKLD